MLENYDNTVIYCNQCGSFLSNMNYNTKAATFKFNHNAWFDLQGKRTPKLPAKETNGIYQVDPKLTKDYKIKAPELKEIGPGAINTK